MNMMKNRVQLIGHLGQSPEIKTLEAGRKVANMSLATNEDYKDANGNKVSEAQWHTIVAWGKMADFAEKYLSKGLQIAVDGKLVNRSYTDKAGVKRNVTEIYVNEMLIITPKK
ncbi:single-stranded DNA-binding protein [Sediminibacterium sp.]|jgi:single-strand DNA-binding protein|uniref:single-stranded DNA-binding protein n=1 Tax=Sediminibacterium sp. TaxID=1917865 RepID=UPI0025D4AA21|nr:single-stranded DNA-binding protein [Sediminibacterium sp.]